MRNPVASHDARKCSSIRLDAKGIQRPRQLLSSLNQSQAWASASECNAVIFDWIPDKRTDYWNVAKITQHTEECPQRIENAE